MFVAFRSVLCGMLYPHSSCSAVGFEGLRKAYDKSKSVVLAEGIPGFYVRALAEMEDFVKEVRWKHVCVRVYL